MSNEIGRHLGLRQLVDLGPLVQLGHVGCGDAPFELAERPHDFRRAQCQIVPIQQHSVIDWKMAEVISQYFQVVIPYLCVRGVKVDYVEGTVFQAAIGNVVIQAAHLAVREAVAFAQAWPTVAAAHELAGETKLQLHVAQQVGNPIDAEFRSAGFFHPQRVSIIEAKGATHAYALLRQALPDGVLITQPLAEQNLLTDGARILGINVHVAVEQGVEQDS